MNWFDVAGTPCHVFEPEPLNAFESIKAIHATTFEEEPLETHFWVQSGVSPLGILVEPTQPETAADSTLMTLCLVHIGFGIQKQIPGSLAIPKNCVIAKDITV
jgi:hypothetical protein